MPGSVAPATFSGRGLVRLFHAGTVVWGVAGAAALVAKGVHDARDGGAWPRWLELTYVSAVIIALAAVAVAGWAGLRVRRAGVVTDDERTAATRLRATAAALVGALAVQVPFFFRAEVPSIAQAQFTVAGALAAYGLARLWLDRAA